MLYILTPIFCVALCVGAVFSFSLNNNKVTANAATAATVGELTINGTGTAANGFVFLQSNLNNLYSKIMNTSDATYEQLKNSLSGTDTYAGAGTVNKMLNSDVINGGAMLKVKFGNFEWQVTSVTTSNDGDVIATLWLTDNNPTVPMSGYSYENNYSATTDQTYMTWVYGTSYMRVVTLNAGGQYVIANSSGVGSLSATQSQKSNNVFANFTMTSKSGNLTKYIVKPEKVKYQEQETWAGSDCGSASVPYCSLNDAYGTPYINDWRNNLESYTSKTGYTYWKSDYLWLPSGAETGGASPGSSYGWAASGVWNMPNDTFRARNNAWQRSTGNGGFTLLGIGSDGKTLDSNDTYVQGAVRPAMHLNLTAAQEDAVTIINKPTANPDIKYNGSEQSYTPFSFDANTMEITGNKATTVGNYTCSVTPKAGYAWTGYDKSAVDIPWKILKGDPNVTCTFVDTALEDADRLLLNNYPTMPPITNSHASATEGTLAWNSGETPKKDQTEYGWTFTPTDGNYNTVQGTKTINFDDARVEGIEVSVVDGKQIYDRYDSYTYSSLADYLKSCIKVNVVYEGNTKTPLINSAYTITTSSIEVTAGEEQQKTIAVRVTSSDTAINGRTGSVTATVKKAVIQSMNVYPVANPQSLVYPVTLDDVKANYEVYLNWNFSDRELIVDDDKITVALQDGTEIKAGTLAFVFTYTDGNLSKTSDPVSVSIAQGTYNLSGITFGGLILTYDGSAHKIEISGTLPEGVSVVYSVAGETATEFTNAGTYEYTASFTHSNPNYNDITITKTATLKIEQADYPDADKIKFENKTVTHTGSAQSIEATDVPEGVAVTYVYNGTEQTTPFEFTDVNESGYEVTAKFAHTNPNYKAIADKTAKLIISEKPTYSITATFEDKEVVYNGNLHTIEISGDLPEGVTVAYYCDGAEFTGATDFGEYEITAKFTGSDEYAPIPDKTATLKITAADYDMSGVTFEDKTVTFNGAEYTLEIGGVALPEWITVSYSVEGQSGTVFTESGVYNFVAKFTHANANYNDIADMTAKLTISDAVVTGVSVVVEDGAKFDVNSTLDDLKAKISAEIEYNNGTKEAVAVDSLILTCDTLRDGGKFEVGTQTITVTYNDGTKDFTTTVEIVVAKAKVAAPVFNGGLSYTGNNITLTAENFNGYDANIMTLVETETTPLKVKNAGDYTAIFVLSDPDRYEWNTASTAGKKVFGAVVYAGESAETAVKWSISKAVLTATQAEGELPVFASESYAGAISDVVTFRYFADADCTQEVAADKLERLHEYYVVAEIADEVKDNFELELSASKFTKPFSYTTPEGELTFWEKAVKFLTSTRMGLVVWLWIVIAVVALILLITIIALAAKSRKKKRIREERRLAEEKAERLAREERDREERRLEREERMARMSQQQAMPQYIPQPMPQYIPQSQPQPQYAPQSQAVQPMIGGNGGGTVSEAQFMQMQAELKAEISALKAEQSAKEIAALRAEVAMRDDISVLRSDGRAQGGMDMETMTEMMAKALQSVFMSASQQAIAAQPAQPAQLTDGTVANATPAATQVPPDAVMTTVTTTKIDTTKKSAQNGQGNAQAARPTRSFVPPMPVDDGRVFDVGGFYKPADAVDIEEDEDNK